MSTIKGQKGHLVVLGFTNRQKIQVQARSLIMNVTANDLTFADRREHGKLIAGNSKTQLSNSRAAPFHMQVCRINEIIANSFHMSDGC